MYCIIGIHSIHAEFNPTVEYSSLDVFMYDGIVLFGQFLMFVKNNPFVSSPFSLEVKPTKSVEIYLDVPGS